MRIEAEDDSLAKVTYGCSKSAAQSLKKTNLQRMATKRGSHIVVTSKSAIAKLNRRKFDGRRRRGYVTTATQTSKLPSVPKTLTKAFVEIRATP